MGDRTDGLGVAEARDEPATAFRSLRPEQPRHLDHQCTRRQLRPALAGHASVPVLGVDDEQFAPWRPLPPQPEVSADVVRGAAEEVSRLNRSVSALEATLLTRRIGKLILYEPPLQDPVEHNLAVADKIERLIQAGQREEAVVTFQREVGQQSPSEIAAMKSRPS